MNLLSVALLAEVLVASKTNALLKTTLQFKFKTVNSFLKGFAKKTTIPKIDLSNMDPSISPLEDFYHFVNLGWLKSNSIPFDSTMWCSIDEATTRTEIVLKGIIKKAAKTSGDLLGDMFNSGMDEKAINKSGLEGISDLFAGVESIQDEEDILRFLGTLQAEGFSGSPFFRLEPVPDSRDSTQVLAHLYQGGLGLPSLEFYFSENKDLVRQMYKNHIQIIFTLAKETFPEQRAADVYQIEFFLANATKYSQDERYNKFTYSELQSLSSINWDGYFTNLGLKPNSFGDIVIDHPPFFESLPEVFTKFKLPQIKNYFKWFILKSIYHSLPKQFQEEGFKFFNRFLRGQQQPLPRWRIVVNLISKLLGDELSKRYVEEVFPPQTKKEALRMVEFLQDALRESIEKLDWMEGSTREKALEKLNKLRVKIGYPDQWEDYSDLKLKKNGSFLQNIRQILRRTKKKKLEGINKKVKEWQWSMQSFDVNAYYSRTRNEIVFPAASFQPPFYFSSNGNFNVADVAFNFGGIGTIIGHELTHAYDNNGRKYDSIGNFDDWWTERDSKNFEERAKTIISQFNKLSFYGQSVNGYFTQGENIADLGGVKISYLAFQKWMKRNGVPKDLHGFSPNQQFFIAYAQSSRCLITKEEARFRLAIDTHSPEIHRVNQPLTNMQEFYDAFGEPNSKQGMYREKEKRVLIW